MENTEIPCQTNNCLSSSLWKFQAQHKIIPITPKPDSLSQPSAINTDNTNNQPPTERERLLSAMEKSGWVQAKAARILNLTPRQIGYALKKYKLEIKKL
jgi:Nif-specific regulatory protein